MGKTETIIDRRIDVSVDTIERKETWAENADEADVSLSSFGFSALSPPSNVDSVYRTVWLWTSNPAQTGFNRANLSPDLTWAITWERVSHSGG